MITKGKPRVKGLYNKHKGDGDSCYGHFENQASFNNVYYPSTILEFSNAVQIGKIHPTQKPVDLIAYLVRTYTNEGDLVLDNCMGSGTTAIACIREHRNFIGFELDKEYYEKSIERINRELQQ